MNSSPNKTTSGADWFAFGLGCFSIALGLIGILTPRRAARTIGVRNHPLIFRLIGLRELASGVGILTKSPKAKAGWLWSRVGGDALDLTLLGTAFTGFRSRRSRLKVATGALAGMTILDTLGALMNTPTKAVRVIKTITVNREPKELYEAWRDFTNLPRFITNLESVTQIDSTHSHWVAKTPAGMHVEWDAEITDDVPNERIAWRSTAEADIAHAGSVEFAPAAGGLGTVVKVTLNYLPPAGKLGELGTRIATMFGASPEQQVEADLHRFGQWIETGFVTSTEGQPAGASRSGSSKFDILTGS